MNDDFDIRNNDDDECRLPDLQTLTDKKRANFVNDLIATKPLLSMLCQFFCQILQTLSTILTFISYFKHERQSKFCQILAYINTKKICISLNQLQIE
jgi:hypothetical protein